MKVCDFSALPLADGEMLARLVDVISEDPERGIVVVPSAEAVESVIKALSASGVDTCAGRWDVLPKRRENEVLVVAGDVRVSAGLAAAIRADVYEIYARTDGIYPCDPDIVPEVRGRAGMTDITFREMRELARSGIGVFDDGNVILAVRAGIPICVRSVFRPQVSTTIRPTRHVVSGTIVGIVAADGFCDIAVNKYLMNREIGFGRRFLQVFEGEGLSYEYMTTGVDSLGAIVGESGLNGIKERRIVNALRRILEPESVNVTHGLTLLTMVGEGICQTPGMVARACQALSAVGIATHMASGGACEVSFMLAIRSEDRDVAVGELYKAFFGERL